MYEEVVESSKGMDGTRMVMDTSGWCLWMSFPNSTIETKWWKAGAGYNTMVSSIFFFPLEKPKEFLATPHHRPKRGHFIG